MCNIPKLDLAGLPLQRQQPLPHRCFQQALGGWWDSLRDLLALPFDIARHQHAAGVRAGALPRSMLESQRFEQQLGLMERLSLGPLARNL
ncbi:MAG TPA: hypothetical protein PKB14_23690 [Rubrivivax sp.]|nr:hypothetical protein [Rubrivivax sp.]